MERTAIFEAERPRLHRMATRVLADRSEAEDIVQQAWLRLHATNTDIANLPAWLTTVTTRLCLDRLRARIPAPEDHREDVATAPDPVESVALAESVGVALRVVLDRLTPTERVAFVLHDSFGFDFSSIATVLDITVPAARKLASRARTKVKSPSSVCRSTDGNIVDAFMAAARGGDVVRLVELLAPDARVTADRAAILAGTPETIDGRDAIVEFFDGSAHAALPVYVDDRPAFAWYHRGAAAVLFDFVIRDDLVHRITFRADLDALARVVRRKDGAPIH